MDHLCPFLLPYGAHFFPWGFHWNQKNRWGLIHSYCEVRHVIFFWNVFVCVYTHTHTHFCGLWTAHNCHDHDQRNLLCLQSEERTVWRKKEQLDSNSSFGEASLQEPRPTGGASRLFAFLDPTFSWPTAVSLSHQLQARLPWFQIWNGTGAGKQENSCRWGRLMGAIEGLGRAEDIAAGRGGVARCSLSSGGKGGEQRRGALHCALTWPHQSGQARPVLLPLLGSTHSAPYRVSALSSHLPSPSSPRSRVWEMSMCRSLGCMRGVFVACTL